MSTKSDCEGACANSVASNTCDKWTAWFHNCPDAACLTLFHDGTIVDLNGKCAGLVGYHREDLLGRPILDYLVIHQMNPDATLNELKEFGALQGLVGAINAKDGRKVEIEASMQLVSMHGELHTLTILRDLTDQKAYERELQSLSVAMEAAVEGIAFVDVNGRYAKVNSAYAEMLGKTPSAMIGQSWRESIHPEDLGAMYAAHADMLEHGKAKIEVRGVSNDKRVFDKQVTLVRIQDEEQNYIGHYRCTTNITDRKVRERAVEASESRLRAIWNSEPESVWVVDRHLAISDTNPAGLQMLGLSDVEQIKGHRSLDYVDSLSRDRVTAAIGRVFEGMCTSVEFEMLGAMGSRHWVESKLAPLLGADGKVEEALIISRDVTEKRYAEAALRRTEERYRDLTENANDIIFTVDAEGHFTSLNRAAESVLGYKRRELLNQSALTIVAPESQEAARRMIESFQAGAQTVSVERYTVKTKDAKDLLIEVSTRSVYDQLQFTGVQGIARDITERERTRQQIAAVQKSEALGRLAAGVAHDFNNVLAVVLACAELQELKPALTENDLKLISQIKLAVSKAAGITSQLLTFSRQKTTEPHSLLLNDVINGVRSILERLTGKNVRLALNLQDDLPKIFADPTQIEQILLNLVVNARDAIAGNGSVTIDTEKVFLDESYAQQHLAAKCGWYVKLTVSDTGCGMDAETQKHVFEPFFTTKKDKGTGLGLATVYGILKAMGGYVWTYSEVGKGTTFKIYFPVNEVEPLPAGKSSAESIAGVATVLVTDDDDCLREIIVDGLNTRGFRTVEASGGKEALEAMKTSPHPIDVILTDLMMPEMGGEQLARKVIQLYPTVKVVIMSGYGGEKNIDGLPITFLEKPFTSENLAQKLRLLLKDSGGA